MTNACEDYCNNLSPIILGAQWKVHRKVISQGFTYDALKNYLKFFNKHAQGLVQNLASEPRHSLHEVLHVTTFRMITEIVIGSDVLTEEDYLQLHHNFEKYM